MSNAYTFHREHSLYFTTMTVVGWVDVFTRKMYRDILYDSWTHCIRKKGLDIHAYVIMTNHVHMIISSRKEPLAHIMRDMKKFTSKKIVGAIRDNKKESRKKWMVNFFEHMGEITPTTATINFGGRMIAPSPFGPKE